MEMEMEMARQEDETLGHGGLMILITPQNIPLKYSWWQNLFTLTQTQ
jgi:hypothetical protein